MTIRPAQKADIPVLVGLLEQLFEIEDDFTFDPSKHARGLELLIDAAGADVFVAETAEGIAGMVSMQKLISTAAGGSSGVIEDLIVDRSHRGEGIGSALLMRIISEALQQGHVRLMLGADLRNDSALAFYERFGFGRSRLNLHYLPLHW